MRGRWAVFGALGALLAVALWLGWGADPPARAPEEAGTPADAGPATAGDRADPAIPRREGEPSADPLEQARAEVAAARVAHGAAREALRQAEQGLDDLEREVDAVERFVEDIEERGDDPARYAFEGMERLGPVIERYEARLATVVEAEAREAEALARLEAAEARLVEARAAASTTSR